MTGTPPHTLRFWEKEFEGILAPLRTNGGQRRYGSEEILVIERIKELKDQGISLNGIKRSLSSEGTGMPPPVSHVLEELVDRLTEMIRTEIYESFRKLNGKPNERARSVRATANAESETDSGDESET